MTGRTRTMARQMTSDALIVAGLLAVFPCSLLVAIAAGPAAGVKGVVAAAAVMAAGWVTGR